VKTLPDNPNLDHLRRQAKDLLAGLRDLRPEASLADAQASLAQQYGFRGWTDLKAEVDRLRGQADVADEALARAVAVSFGLGEVTGPMMSVARADEMGRRWSLETEPLGGQDDGHLAPDRRRGDRRRPAAGRGRRRDTASRSGAQPVWRHRRAGRRAQLARLRVDPLRTTTYGAR